jgi:glycosyltransferase involved in cell wall biosynthesis
VSGPRAPRLLMTADAVGGVWTYALDLACGLSEVGVDTVLVVMGPSPGADQIAQARAIPRLRLVDTGLPLDWLATAPAAILAARAALRDLARETGADLIHLNSPALAAGGEFPTPVVGVCHSCTATWWTAVKAGPPPADFRWRAEALGKGLRACDVLVAPTRAFARMTARAYAGAHPVVVRNGRRPAQGVSGPREPMVFTSGRLWDEGKNVAVLDRAALLAPARLVAAGPLDGPDGGAIRLRHAQALGRISPREVAAWLARAPIFASAALYEPFGLGVLEAAQAGCALVLSDIPTFRELWAGAAVFVPASDAAGFAAAFRQLSADPEETGWLGRLARIRSRRYTAEAMLAGMLAIYRQRRPNVFAPPGRVPEAAA